MNDESEVRVLKKLSILLCVCLLMGGAVPASAAVPGILDLAWEGTLAGQTFPGIAPTPVDYTITNEYGTFQITEVLYTANVIHYLVVATPRDDSIRFILYGDPVPVLHLQDPVETYRVICTPQGGYPLWDGYGADPIERDGQLITCYTFAFVDPPDPTEPFELEMHLYLQDDASRAFILDDVFPLIIARGTPCQAYAIDVNEWFADVFVRRVDLYASPLDISFVIIHDDAGPGLDHDGAMLSVSFDGASPRSTIGAMLPTQGGIACTLSPWPEGVALPDKTVGHDTLVLLDRDTWQALVLDLATGQGEWMDARALSPAAQRSFRVTAERWIQNPS